MLITTWLKAVRAPFFTAVIIPVILGTTFAFYSTGLFNPANFLLVLISMVMIHGGINLSNDYFDHKSGNDEANKTPTPFSGGSRMIQNKILQSSQVLNASLLLFATGSIIGLYLFLLLGQTILYLGIIGILIGFFYTAPPFKFGYRGLGELLVAFGFGSLIVIGSYFVQATALSLTAFYVSVPIAILIGLVLFINEFPDHNADKSTKKNTLVVILGKSTSAKLYQFFMILIYLWTVVMVYLDIFPVHTLITLITFPMAFVNIKIIRKNFDKINELLPANAGTIKLHLSFGLLLTIGFLSASFL